MYFASHLKKNTHTPNITTTTTTTKNNLHKHSQLQFAWSWNSVVLRIYVKNMDGIFWKMRFWRTEVINKYKQISDLHVFLVFEGASVRAAVKIRTPFPVWVYKSRSSPVYSLFYILIQNLLLDKWIVVVFVTNTNFCWCLGCYSVLPSGLSDWWTSAAAVSKPVFC